MHDPHTYPSHIFTNQLNLSHIVISHTTFDVTLLGCYSDLLDFGMPTIAIETDFASLNDLLFLAGEEAEPVIERISKCLLSAAGDETILDITDGGGLCFSEIMFSFLLLNEGEVKIPELAEHTYVLSSWIPYDESFPGLVDDKPPQDPGKRIAYFNSVLAIQYHFYLAYKKRMDHTSALFTSNLSHPLAFNLAQTQYELQKSGQTS
jgi:hypothetical protein